MAKSIAQEMQHFPMFPFKATTTTIFLDDKYMMNECYESKQATDLYMWRPFSGNWLALSYMCRPFLGLGSPGKHNSNPNKVKQKDYGQEEKIRKLNDRSA